MTGWYFVADSIYFNDGVTVSGEAHLILADGTKMNADCIRVNSGNTLNIYGQTDGTGKLIATPGGSITYDACIGASEGSDCRTIVINGGDISAQATTVNGGAGIGASSSCGVITINGGKVTAKGYAYKKDIGGASGSVTINGDQITANANGIGGSTVSLGWKDASTDFIQSPSYAGAVSFQEGKPFILDDGTNLDATADNIGGKKIVPKHGEISYNLDNAAIDGIAEYYAPNDEGVSIQYSVIYPGNVTLQKGADYTATITDIDNRTVDAVKTPGVYTLTITGAGSYTGTKTSTIIVYGYKETLGGYEFSTSGDEEGLYYLVDSEEALRAIATYVNSGNNAYGKRFKQTQNISLTGGDFRPIGEYSVFNGTYDGGNFHISNLTVAKEYGYLGLFGLIGDADCGTTVKNVVLVSPTIATTEPNGIRSSSVAALIAVAMQDCTVDNCIVINPTFSIAGTNTNVGVGVIAKRLGYNNSITNCCFYDSNADNNYPAINQQNANYNAITNVERVYKITATGCNTTATPTVSIDGTDYYKQGTAVTVSATVPSSGMKKFTATGVEASLTETLGQYTLTMPANDVTVSLADFTPTVTVAEATYSGKPLTPAITVKDGETPLTADTDYDSVSYANNTNAGNSASVSVTGKGWYLGSASQTFSISKAAAPVSLQDAQKPAAISDLTYTGEAQALVTAPTTAPEGYTVQYSADGGTTWSESVPTGTNAGEYAVKVRYQGDGNHTDFDSDDISVSVGKASITPSVSIEGWTYGETANEPSVTGNTENGAVTYSYKLKTAEDNAYDSATPTAAGAYKVRAVIAETDNYLGKTVEAEFAIAQAALTVTASSGSVTYGEAPKDFGVTYSGFVNSDAESVLSGTVSYSFDYEQYGNTGTYKITPSGLSAANYAITYADGALTVNPKTIGLTWGDTTFSYDGTEKLPTATATGLVNNDTCTVTVTGGQTDVGENYTATASELSNANYALPAENTVSFKIILGTQDGVSAEDYTGTYDGAAHSITVTASNGGTVTYSETESGTYAATNPAYTNAGTYTVYYKVARTGYNDATGSANVTINQKTVGLTWGETSFAYDGASKLPTATATGLIDGDTCTVTVTGAQTEVGENYTATASALSNSNYTLPSANTTSFSIVPGTQDGITAADYTGTYDGAAHSVTVTASNGGTVTYSETQDGTYSATNPTYTNAGTYTVYYKVEKSGYNDATGSANVKIHKKSVTVSGLTAAEKTYDGSATAELVATNAAYDGLLSGDSLSVTGTAVFADAEAGDSKTVNISGLALGGTSAGNYTLSSDTASGTGKITKRPITITAANQTVGLARTISEGADKVEVSSGSLADGHSISAITLTASDTSNVTTSGTITPSAATIKSGDADVTANYDITYANGVLTVSEGAPTVTAPTAKTGLAYTGDEQELVNAGSVTGGTMEYVLGTDGTDAPTEGYGATIPTGTDVGTYYVWYKVTGDGNHSDIAAACVTVTIGKADSSVAAPTANALTYNGAAQELVTAGSATGGALQYVLGANGTTAPTSGYDMAIPMGTDAGTYYVWYKVTGDSDHTDTAPACVTVAIGKKAATVTANAQTVNLNGNIQTGTSNAALSGAVDGHTLSAVTLTGSDTANATTSGTITPSAAKIASGETDVTANYSI